MFWHWAWHSPASLCCCGGGGGDVELTDGELNRPSQRNRNIIDPAELRYSAPTPPIGPLFSTSNIRWECDQRYIITASNVARFSYSYREMRREYHFITPVGFIFGPEHLHHVISTAIH